MLNVQDIQHQHEFAILLVPLTLFDVYFRTTGQNPACLLASGLAGECPRHRHGHRPLRERCCEC